MRQSIPYFREDNVNITIIGLSLVPLPPTTSQLPIIYDSPPTLTPALGLLHPLGGGRQALDTIVVLDRKGRRRMALPITRVGAAWEEDCVIGCNKCTKCEILDLMRGKLIEGIKWLETERDEDEADEKDSQDINNRISGDMMALES
jgi:hypothetical protein